MHTFSTLSLPTNVLATQAGLSIRRQQRNNKKVLSTSDAGVEKWDARFAYEVPHTNTFYLTCGLGGVLSCGLTHLAVTPLDVAKCNMQVDPAKYKVSQPTLLFAVTFYDILTYFVYLFVLQHNLGIDQHHRHYQKDRRSLCSFQRMVTYLDWILNPRQFQVRFV